MNKGQLIFGLIDFIIVINYTENIVVNYIIYSIDRFMYYQIYLAKASRILPYKVHPLWE